MKIIVSIVSFNVCSLLEQCLRDLVSQKSKHQIEIWVLDNASEDQSVEMIKKKFPKIKLIESSKNLGFAKGHNKILKKAKGDYCLILNPDTEIPIDAIDKMVSFMEHYPKCGISSCKILDFQGNLQSNGGDLPTGLALISWLFNLEILGDLPNFHRGEKDYYNKVREVGWVGGTFMFVRNDVFEKVGYLDESYFMYFEDAHFCYSALKKGFRVMINPEVITKHVSGASSKDPRFRQWNGEFIGLIKFYQKEFGSSLAQLVRLMVLGVVILRVIAFALLGKFNIAKTYGKIISKI